MGQQLFTAVLDPVILSAEQTPEYNNIRFADHDGGDFLFVPVSLGATATVTAAPAAPEPAAVSVDMQVWDRIEDSTNPADFVTFIDSFPSSPMVPFARNKLEQLETALVVPPEPEAPAAEPAVGVYPETFKDCPNCPEMVVIPRGKFVMGSLESEEGRSSDEGPQHTVRIERPFALGKYQVTRGEFATFVRETGHEAGACIVWTGSEFNEDGSKGWRDPGYGQTDRDPVVCVSWDDAPS